MSQASPPRRSMVSTAGSSRKSVSSSGSRGTPGPPTANSGAGASTTASSRQGRVSKTPLMDAKRRATALRRRMDPTHGRAGAPVNAFLSAPSTILRLERKDRLGSWNPSQPLFFALMAQQGGAGVPRRPPPGLLEDHITCADWEWTTALVRAVLRHTRGDERRVRVLTRKRAETDVVEGCLVRCPDVFGVQREGAIATLNEGGASCHIQFTDDGTIRKNVPRINLVLLDDGGHDPGGPVRNARPGERNLHKLWYNSWGLDVLGREREMKRLTRLRESRRLAALPGWRDLISEPPHEAPKRVKPEEKPPIAAKARKAAKSLLFINRTDLLAKAKLDAATVAERQREADEKAAKEARVVRALGAFDKQRREIYHCLKQAIQTCNDKSLLNMQRREACPSWSSWDRPDVESPFCCGIKRAAILGIQRAVVDAVEAIRAWQEPPPQDDDSDDDDARTVESEVSAVAAKFHFRPATAERPPSAPAEGPVVDGAGTPAPSAPPSARPAPPPPPAPRQRRRRAGARRRLAPRPAAGVLEGDAARSRRPSQQSSDGGESVDEGALFGAGTKANTGSVEGALSEIAAKKRGREKAVAPPKPPKPPPPDPKPFIWNGVDFLLSVRHAMDFLGVARLRRASGGEFPLANPFAQPQPIDEPVQGQVDDHATAPDSDDDDGDGARGAREGQGAPGTWPHQGHSDHQQRIEACRVYVLEAEVRHRRRAEEDRKALRHAMRERRARRSSSSSTRRSRSGPGTSGGPGTPWNHNDPTGKKRKMLEKRAKTPGAPKRIPRSESLPRILRPTVTRL
ncbi:hypothetical protein SO694_00145068 [Aureococcus anophagefferens]|uniref:Uncharacterized protein n=1 Tax=Aureococcus anophagefferens TaxID=44056 RepID=A0ABR1FPN7_AURAN